MGDLPFTGEVEIIEPGEPEAQCRRTHHHRPGLRLAGAERPLLPVSPQQGLQPLFVEASVGSDAPVVGGDRQIVEQQAIAGIVEIDDSGQSVADEQRIVPEQIGMNDAAGQPFEMVVGLEHELLFQQPPIGRFQQRLQCPRGPCPPVGTAGIGPVFGESLPHPVNPPQLPAKGKAMGRSGVIDTPARQALHQRSGFPFQHTQIVPLPIGEGMGRGNAMLGQIGHQVQKIIELIRRMLLEQGKHILALLSGDEVVGVLDSGADTGEFDQATMGIVGQKPLQLGALDDGVNRHSVIRSPLKQDPLVDRAGLQIVATTVQNAVPIGIDEIVGKSLGGHDLDHVEPAVDAILLHPCVLPAGGDGHLRLGDVALSDLRHGQRLAFLLLRIAGFAVIGRPARRAGKRENQ